MVLLAGARGVFAFPTGPVSYGPSAGGVPEIDPTTAVSGLMLCAGAAMLLLERYRGRK
jgi:hypothetical protein